MRSTAVDAFSFADGVLRRTRWELRGSGSRMRPGGARVRARHRRDRRRAALARPAEARAHERMHRRGRDDVPRPREIDRERRRRAFAAFGGSIRIALAGDARDRLMLQDSRSNSVRRSAWQRRRARSPPWLGFEPDSRPAGGYPRHTRITRTRMQPASDRAPEGNREQHRRRQRPGDPGLPWEPHGRGRGRAALGGPGPGRGAERRQHRRPRGGRAPRRRRPLRRQGRRAGRAATSRRRSPTRSSAWRRSTSETSTARSSTSTAPTPRAGSAPTPSLGASLAVAKAGADESDLPLYRYVGGANAHVLPVPCLNVLNGGAHADSNVDLQEFMLAPVGRRQLPRGAAHGRGDVPRAQEAAARPRPVDRGRRRRWLRARPARRTRRRSSSCSRRSARPGTHRATTSRSRSTRRPTEFFHDGTYDLAGEGRKFSSAEFADYLADLCDRYPIISIEDGMAEDDWDGWAALTGGRRRPGAARR